LASFGQNEVSDPLSESIPARHYFALVDLAAEAEDPVLPSDALSFLNEQKVVVV
jgi:hypothetical protein